ncbi:MAG TPA: hypothetical protein PLV92_09720, partial [Pirellulaceae bacterium]|nr:hypothetical protein [Pirellulaceae bacterium]
MADSFDPYHSLLGIPPAEQPANHYRMLGVSLFEASRDVISNAADARMTYLRSLQTGPRAALTQRILNELSAARLVLLDPQKKAEYDRQLAAQLQTQTPSPPQLQSQGHPRPQVTRQPSTSLLASQIAQPAPPNAEGEFQVTAAARTSRAGRHSTPIAALAIGGSVCAFVLLMVVVIALQGGGGVVGGGSASEDGQKGNGGSSSAVASAAGQSPQPPVANSVGTRPPSTGSTPPNAASSGAPSSKP